MENVLHSPSWKRNLVLLIGILLVVLPLVSAAADPQVWGDNGTISYYDFDEGTGTTAVDSQGAVDLTVADNWDATGILGKSKIFDGTGADYGLALNGLHGAIEAITFNFWINITGANWTGEEYLIGNRDASGSEAGIVEVYGATGGVIHLRMYYDDGSLKATTTSMIQPPLDTWTMLTIIINSSSAMLYSNGAFVSSTGAAAGNFAWSARNFWFLDEPGKTGANNGLLDELGMWNRTLNASEITYLYNGGAGRAWEGEAPPVSPSLDIKILNFVNMSVGYGELFEVAVNVTCRAAYCGGVNVTLDPEPVSIMYAPTWDETRNRDGTYTRTMYSGVVNVLDENYKYVKVWDAKSLMNKGSHNIKYLEDDGTHQLKVLDFNYSSITLNFGFNESNLGEYEYEIEDGKMKTKYKIIRINETTGEEYEEEIEIEIEEGENQTMTIYENPFGKEFHLGENSTTVVLQAVDTENMDDTRIYEGSADANDGSATDVHLVDSTDSTDSYVWIRFKIDSLFNNHIVRANLSLYEYADTLSGGQSFVATANMIPPTVTWNEGTLTWNNEDTTGEDTSESDYHTITDGNTGWIDWNITKYLSSQINLSYENITIRIVTSGEVDIDGSETINLWSKEHTTSSVRPKLTVIYNSKDTKGGVLPVGSGVPFYVNESNPMNTPNLTENASAIVTFLVNATGDLDTTWIFYAWANHSETQSIGNTSEVWNVTIEEQITPQVNLTYPLNTTYTINVSEIYYTGNGTFCWYSLDDGATNASPISCGANWTDLTSTEGSNSWWVFSNSTQGDENSSSVVFFKDTQVPNPMNITGPLNTTFIDLVDTLNYTANDTYGDSCWYSRDDGGTNSTHESFNTNFTSVTSVQGINEWVLFCNDTANNLNSTSRTFFIDSITPDLINFTYPLNQTYTTNVSDINYYVNDANLDSCWYSVDDGTTNSTRQSCGTNWTDITSIEGPNTWVIWVNDTANNQNTSSVTFFKDTQVPDPMNITGPLNDSYTAEVDTLNYTANDTYGDSCWYSRDDGVTNSTYVAFNTNFTGITSDQGSNTWVLYCNDTANNLNSTSRTFYLDSLPPSINLTGPLSGFLNYLPTDLNYTYSEAAADSCWYSLNNGTTNSSRVSCGTNWTGLTATEGTNAWTVYINESTTNVHNDSIVSFWVDTIIPGLINISYPENTTYTTNVSELKYEANDTSLDSCWFSIDDGVTNSSPQTCSANWTVMNSTEGSNTWVVWVNDTTNNQNSTSVTFFKDTIPPEINLTGPLAGANYSVTSIDLNYTYTEVNWDSCWYSLDNGTTNSTRVNCGTNWSGLTATEGINTWIIYINETISNIYNESVISFNVDTIVPDLMNITYPLNITYSVNVSELNYTVNDTNLDSCWFTIDGGVTNSSSQTCGTNWTVMNSTEGSNTWTVYANDTFNNLNWTTVAFIKDGVAPLITLSYPVNGTVFVQNSINLEYNYTETTPDRCWYSRDLGATNISLQACGTNWTVSAGVGNHTWMVFINDSAGNVAFDNVSFEVTDFQLNSETAYNVTNYVTMTQTMGLNISYLPDNYTAIVNFTYQTHTVTGYSSNVTTIVSRTTLTDNQSYYEYNFTAREEDVSTGNNTFYWSIVLDDGVTEDHRNTSSNNQTVFNVWFDLCNVTYPTSYIIIDFKDDETDAAINASIDASTWDYWLGDGSVKKSLYYSNNTPNANYSFCFGPINETLYNDLTMQYSNGATYPTRVTTQDTDLNATERSLTLYLLPITGGQYVSFQIQDQNSVGLTDVDVVVERQFEGVWNTIGNDVSDDSGLVTFFLDPDYDHRFTFTKTDYDTQVFTVRPTQTIYTIFMEGGTGSKDAASYSGSLAGITWKFFPGSGMIPEGTQAFYFNVTAEKDNIVSCKFSLKNSSHDVLKSETTGCGASGGSVVIYYNMSTGEKVWGAGYIDVGDGLFLVDGDAYWINETIDRSGLTLVDIAEDWRNLGLFGDPDVDGANKVEFGRILIAFTIIILFLGIISSTGWDLSTAGGLILLIYPIILFLSFFGWFDFAGLIKPSWVISATVATWLDQYIFAMMASFFSFGYILNYWSKVS